MLFTVITINTTGSSGIPAPRRRCSRQASKVLRASAARCSRRPLWRVLPSRPTCPRGAFGRPRELQPRSRRGCTGGDGSLCQGHGERPSASWGSACAQGTQHGREGRNALSEVSVSSRASKKTLSARARRERNTGHFARD